MAKLSAPGAIIIHFFGGIHEIYFPYVLSHPIMIVAMWAGGIAADIVFVATNAGLVATPSPGSIFAYLAVIPPGQHFGVLLGVAVGAVASFARRLADPAASTRSSRPRKRSRWRPTSAIARRRSGLTSERQRGTRRPAPLGVGRRIIISGGAL